MQSQICAVGWEPNPLHTAYLRELERSYRRCGYRVTIFTGTGVGVRRDNLTFASVDTVSHTQADNTIITFGWFLGYKAFVVLYLFRA